MNLEKIDAAIQRSFDGSLSEEEGLKLRAVLKADPAARALYYEQAALHQALAYRFAPLTVVTAAKSQAHERARIQSIATARKALLVAAAAVVILGVVLKLMFVPETRALASFRTSEGSLYTVTHSERTDDSEEHELSPNSSIQLSQGSLEINFSNGSRAVVLAPAVFRLKSDKLLELGEGTAWFDVSVKGHGFQVSTPRMMVTDLGTQFGVVSTSEKAHEVHVFSGHVVVNMRNADDQAGIRLSAGEALASRPSGQIESIENAPEAFFTQLPKRAQLQLIANGDFESGNKPFENDYGTPATAASLPFWSFGDRVVVSSKTGSGSPGYGSDEKRVFSSTEDVQIGFNDETQGRPEAKGVTISQNFTTEPGVRYRVAFEMGALFHQDHEMEITASVRAHSPEGPIIGERVERRHPSKGTGYNDPTSFTFTAESEVSVLVFTETSAISTSADPTLDNISVVPMPHKGAVQRD